MKQIALALASAALVLVAGASAAPTTPDVVAFNAAVKVVVDSQGRPTLVQASQDLPAAVRSAIEKRVASWQYSTGTRNGVSVPATTYVFVGACALPTADGKSYRMGVDFKGNGPRPNGRFGMLPPPGYPMDMNRRGIGGTFLVDMRIGKDGRVTPESIKPEQPDGAVGERIFESALRAWIASLRYEPETVASEAVATSLRLPVTFVSYKHGGQSRIERKQKTLQQSECQLAGAAQPVLQAVALDTPVKVTPVPAG